MPRKDVSAHGSAHRLPSADLAPPLDVTPQRKEEKTFEALLRQVEHLARQQPVLISFDDLHWVDPSSRELLERAIERVSDWPVVLLAMFRPEFQPPWTGQPHVTTLALTRLDRRDTAVMVAKRRWKFGAASRDRRGDHRAHRRCAVVRRGANQVGARVGRASKWGAFCGATHGVVGSCHVHASLMARLDRLGPAAKDVAQTGAAIGREFGHGLLAAVSDLSEPQLHEALHRLTNAGRLFVRGTPPE